MLEKESQSSESKNEEIDSLKAEVLTEEKLILKAEKMLTKEKEVNLKEKTKIIRNYFKNDFSPKKDTSSPPFHFHRILMEDEKRVKKFFLELTPKKLESTLGKEELNLVFRVISERSNLLKQMERNNFSEENIKEFIEQNGYKMLPCRIHQTLDDLKMTSYQLRDLFLYQWDISKSKYLNIWKKKNKKPFIQQLKTSFLDLKIENKRWQECSKFETEKENSIKIQGFEEFDFPGMGGEKIIKKALEILPKEVSAMIESIEFEKKILPMSKHYGLSGIARAAFHPQETKHKITFYLPVPLEEFNIKKKISYLKKIPFSLAHEWGHSLDSRIVDQKDLTPQKQLEMIIEWEKIRVEEAEWSDYVLGINNPDQKKEKFLKSKESFAESTKLFFENLYMFRLLCPKRAKFITNLLKKRFPEFDLKKSFKAKKECDDLFGTLEKRLETKRKGAREKGGGYEKFFKKLFNS